LSARAEFSHSLDPFLPVAISRADDCMDPVSRRPLRPRRTRQGSKSWRSVAIPSSPAIRRPNGCF